MEELAALRLETERLRSENAAAQAARAVAEERRQEEAHQPLAEGRPAVPCGTYSPLPAGKPQGGAACCVGALERVFVRR